MPLFKHQRSDYVHLDSVEPDLWTRIAALFKNISGTVNTIVPDETPVVIADSAAMDAFARLRVSNPTTLWDSQNQYDLGRIHWQDKVTNNSGNAAITHNADGAEAELYVEDSDTVVRQTRRYIRYQPGKSQLVLVTFVMDNPNVDCTQRVGYFDGENGVFFENDAADYNLVIRSSTTGSPVDTEISQANWNIDAFDGTGPSGITLDFTKAQILLVDMEWLGVGRVRAGFVVDGIPYYAHEFLHANIVSGVYMTTANLPIRYEISGTASLGVGKTLQAICSSVSSEGGFHIAGGLQFAVDNEITTRSVTNSAYLPLLAIRPKATFNGITNRGRIIPASAELYAQSQPVHYDIIWGATIVGGAWVSAGDDSIVEYNATATSLSGGIDAQAGYVAASNQSRGSVSIDAVDNYPLCLDIDGNHPTSPFTDSWVIAARALATSTNCAASLEFREIR